MREKLIDGPFWHRKITRRAGLIIMLGAVLSLGQDIRSNQGEQDYTVHLLSQFSDVKAEEVSLFKNSSLRPLWRKNTARLDLESAVSFGESFWRLSVLTGEPYVNAHGNLDVYGFLITKSRQPIAISSLGVIKASNRIFEGDFSNIELGKNVLIEAEFKSNRFEEKELEKGADLLIFYHGLNDSRLDSLRNRRVYNLNPGELM